MKKLKIMTILGTRPEIIRLSRVMDRLDRYCNHVLLKEKPDAVLILGDTNSAISAIMARRMKIPVYHMEAGNRSFDRNVPEETNRRLVDHIVDFNLVYTEHARRHLLSEGLEHRRIVLTGSPMREVLEHFRPRIEQSDILWTVWIGSMSYSLG